SAGNYTVTVTDNNGCTSTANATITQPTALTASTTVNSNVSCNGGSDGSATASAVGGTTPYTYLWSNAATTAAISGVSAGNYTVTVTDNNGCTSTANATVTQPSLKTTSANINACRSEERRVGNSARARAVGGTTPYTYLWSNAATTAAISGVSA